MDRQDSVVLPYEFDSSGTPALIVRGVLGLLFLVVVPGILYSLVVSRSVAAAAQLLIVGGVVVYFGRLFLRNLETARGTITQGVVVVQPGSLYGIRLAGPAGRFPVPQFESVRVERIPAPVEARGRHHERVRLIGRKGTPDILVARTALDAGQPLGRGLAAALGLRYEEVDAPY